MEQRMNRRDLLKATAAATAGSAVLAGCAVPATRNEDVYVDGTFDEDRAKDAVLAMCRRCGYPVFPGMREKLWVSDYGTGQYDRLGLAATMFENHYGDGAYMLMDLFLLPGQMLPEHWHLAGDHGIVKNEGWLVRWGRSYIVGAGDDNLSEFPQVQIPACHDGGRTKTGHVIETGPGQFVPLAQVGTRHWQYGGPEGAIITEVANFHTNTAVRHTDAAINEHFLGS